MKPTIEEVKEHFKNAKEVNAHPNFSGLETCHSSLHTLSKNIKP